MEIDTQDHIFPRSEEEAILLSGAFKGELARLGTVDPLLEWLVEERACIGISSDLQEAIAESVAGHFGISRRSVLVVGSARLGFSVSEKRTDDGVKPRYRPFTETSDIDVAVIDGELFDEMWRRTFLGFIAKNRYRDPSETAQFMFKGWFRPDKLPYKFPERNEWFDFFQKLSEPIHFSEMKINGGSTNRGEFLAAYQRIAFRKCLSELKLRGEA